MKSVVHGGAKPGSAIFNIDKSRSPAPNSPRAKTEIAADPPVDGCPIRHSAVARLPAQDFERLRAATRELRVKRGAAIFNEGDTADSVFSIKSGAVLIYKQTHGGRRQVVGFLYDGDLLGVSADDSYAYSAEAILESTLNRYPRALLDHLVETYPGVEHQLCVITRHELAEAQEQLLVIGRSSAPERVAGFLLKLLRHARDHGRDATTLDVPMTRHAIGDYLGLSTETVSRTLTAFREDGLISGDDPHCIDILNEAALQQVADGG